MAAIQYPFAIDVTARDSRSTKRQREARDTAIVFRFFRNIGRSIRRFFSAFGRRIQKMWYSMALPIRKAFIYATAMLGVFFATFIFVLVVILTFSYSLWLGVGFLFLFYFFLGLYQFI